LLKKIVAYALALMAGPFLWTQGISMAVTKGDPDSAQVADLVLANHILADLGLLDGNGHVTVRDARNPTHYLMSRNVPSGTVTAADIFVYDLDSNPVSHVDESHGERYIHGEIYKARPDVMAIVHTHSPDVIPFGVTAVPLRPVIHMAGWLPQRVPVFDSSKASGEDNLLIRTPMLGHALAQALGSNPAILLHAHGAVVVGASLHEAVGRSYYMTVNARTETQSIQLSRGKVDYLTAQQAKASAPGDGYEHAWIFWKSKLDKQQK
jgi:HCOMODA/2-hydroxy-3-carboxy-muconic semialdehyde decarboxylase